MITTDPEATYLSVTNSPTAYFDKTLNIYFDSKDLCNAYKERLGYRCPICYAEYAKTKQGENPKFRNEKELIRHVSSVHNLVLCNLCLSNLKIFPFEMKCYKKNVSPALSPHLQEIDRHNRFGLTDSSLDYRVDPHPVLPSLPSPDESSAASSATSFNSTRSR